MAYVCVQRFEGQGLLEYGLIIALVALVGVVGLQLLGSPTSGLFSQVVAGFP